MRLIVSVHAIAAVACWLNALPVAAREIGLILIGVSLLQTLRAMGRVLYPVELRYSDVGGWVMQDGENFLPIELSVSSVSVSWIVLLRYRFHQQNWRSLLIFRDSLEAEEYRQLKVALRIAVIS
ncbi:MAG: protein YgfX [Gammaproteobacteria bacterium]